MYFTDRGLEELADRRGEEQVTLAWLADQMQAFVDEFPDFEVPVERLATWLARGGTDDDVGEGGRPRRVAALCLASAWPRAGPARGGTDAAPCRGRSARAPVARRRIDA